MSVYSTAYIIVPDFLDWKLVVGADLLLHRVVESRARDLPRPRLARRERARCSAMVGWLVQAAVVGCTSMRAGQSTGWSFQAIGAVTTAHPENLDLAAASGNPGPRTTCCRVRRRSWPQASKCRQGRPQLRRAKVRLVGLGGMKRTATGNGNLVVAMLEGGAGAGRMLPANDAWHARVIYCKSNQVRILVEH